MNGFSSKVMGWTFTIALVLHWLAFQAPLPGKIQISDLLSLKKNPPIEVDTYNGSDRLPVVRSARVEEDDAKEEKAKFFGEFKNRVKKETQTPLKGLYEEGKIVHRGGGEDIPATEDPNGEASGLGMKDLMSFSRSPNALPGEIAEGGQTLLNTDKVLYASFINRIADEIYEPWVKFGQGALHEVLGRGRKLEPNLFVTKLSVMMNEFGEVTGMTILQSSGIRELDEAPKKAFWQIARFPNPPSQLFDKDGFIRLTYEFHFEWKSSGFNIVPWQI